MSPSRIAKSLMRRLRVTWREQPTQHDIEAVEENMRRVGLVIRFRWGLVAALAVFSVVAGFIYTSDASIPRAAVIVNMRIPAAALLFVLGYNTYYQLTYRYLGNIAILNHAQLLFDSLVVTLLVHYSGGAYSWFYTMYALIVLEAAFIFTRPRDTWLVTGFAAVSYGAVVLVEYLGWLPHANMPYVGSGLEHNGVYAAVRFLWSVTLFAGTAITSLQMMQRVHAREAQLSASATSDEATGLMNRVSFQRQLAMEVGRAHCYGRALAVLLLDVDDFATFNRRFGTEAGNKMLRAIAALLLREVCECGDTTAELNTVSRYGGEEFALILAHPPGLSTEEAAAEAAALADRLRERVGALRVEDMGVTVSVGMALYPRDGRTPLELLASADQAVFAAATAGGNRLATSDEGGIPTLAV